MSAITGTSAGAAASADSKPRDLRDVDVSQFLELLITELQNQDPLNPMENSEMVQQIGLIREISATNQLSETLSGFANTQQLTTASGLIGRRISGLSDAGEEITGVVDRVSVETNEDSSERNIKVYVGGNTIDVKNVRDIRTE